MNTKYTNIWRVLSLLSIVVSYVCYRSLGTSYEIAMNWSWPIHLVVMVVAGAAILNFIKARNTAMNAIAKQQWDVRKKWLGKLAIESITMVIMLAMTLPALIIFNKAGPDFQNVEGLKMFYLSWVAFSVLAAIYFFLLQPLVSKGLAKYAS